MDLEHAVGGRAEDEGEGVQRQVGAEPDELGPVHVQGRAQLGLQQPPGGGVDPVGGDHQVAVGEGVQVGRLPLEGQLDPDLAAAPLEDLQQPLAGDGREHVPAGADGPAAVDHVDGAPAGEGVGDLHVARVVGVAQPQGLLREHHPQPKVASEALRSTTVISWAGRPAWPAGRSTGRRAAQDPDAHPGLLSRARRPGGRAGPGRRRWAAGPGGRSRRPRSRGRSP